MIRERFIMQNFMQLVSECTFKLTPCGTATMPITTDGDTSATGQHVCQQCYSVTHKTTSSKTQQDQC